MATHSMNLTTIVFTHRSALNVWEQREVIKRLQMREPPVQLGTMTLDAVEGAGLGKHRITDAIPRRRLVQRLGVCLTGREEAT